MAWKDIPAPGDSSQGKPESPSPGFLSGLRARLEAGMRGLQPTPEVAVQQERLKKLVGQVEPYLGLLPMDGGNMGGIAKQMEKFAMEKPPQISMHPSSRLKGLVDAIGKNWSGMPDKTYGAMSRVAPNEKLAKFWTARGLMQKVYNDAATPEEISWLIQNGYKVPR